MAGKTYLQLVNQVLTNLREQTVTTVSQTVISNLVGQFINQAKEKVEDSFSWNVLTTHLSFNTIGDQTDYILDGTSTTPTVTTDTGRFCNERTSIIVDQNARPMVFDVTLASQGSVTQLDRIPRETQIGFAYTATSNGRQLPYLFSYTNENFVPTLRLYRNPDDNKIIDVWCTIPQVELASDTDTILVPFRPVVTFATALALDERGEELGQDSELYYTTFSAELLRAQLLDANPSEQQFQALGVNQAGAYSMYVR
jgi:hypothetical protein